MLLLLGQEIGVQKFWKISHESFWSAAENDHALWDKCLIAAHCKDDILLTIKGSSKCNAVFKH